MAKIGIIVGSTRPKRAGGPIAHWVAEQASKNSEHTFELIDLAEANLPLLDEEYSAMMNRYQNEHTKQWSAKIAQFDGFIFVTPEYNHGYSAVLKNAIDYLYAEWNHKPAAFVGYSAIPTAGVRAIEQLKQVVWQVKMLPVFADVTIAGTRALIEDDAFKAPEGAENELKALLAELNVSLTAAAALKQPATA